MAARRWERSVSASRRDLPARELLLGGSWAFALLFCRISKKIRSRHGNRWLHPRCSPRAGGRKSGCRARQWGLLSAARTSAVVKVWGAVRTQGAAARCVVLLLLHPKHQIPSLVLCLPCPSGVTREIVINRPSICCGIRPCILTLAAHPEAAFHLITLLLHPA